MAEKIDSKILSEEEYNKYLDECNEYYKLKKKYTKQTEIVKNKIISSDKSIADKKKIFAKHEYTCVNCGKKGGTIFTESKDMLKVNCGNVSEPCSLNMEIIKMNTSRADNELTQINKKITDVKNKIVLTKLDYMFEYLQEDKAVEMFEDFKKLLENYQEIFNETYRNYMDIVNNDERNNLLNEKMIEYYENITNYKETYKLYKDTGQDKYLKEAIELYVLNIKPLDNVIRDLKYRHNSVEFIKQNDNDSIYEELKFLIQQKYNIEDLEIIKLPE